MARRLTPPRAPDAAATAETVLRVAVLLQAGAAPAQAWRHLADSGDAAAQRIVVAHEAGAPLVDAIAAAGPDAWPDVAAAWRVALTVGAPLADSLRGIAGALRDAHEAADDVRVALAEPAGTARLMSWLPLVGLGLGALLGFDTMGVLVAQPLGIACLVAGGTLIAGAHRWSARLVRHARADGGVPGLRADVVAIALSGGVSIDRALELTGAALGNAVRAEDGDTVAEVLALSRAAGVPAIELLRASAAHARHRARVDGRLRAARLSTRLLLPLGVCTLPAFLLLGVAPMLLSVLTTMPLSI